MVAKRALLSFVLFTLVSVPLSVFAAETSFFGPIIPQEGDKCYCPGKAMDWGCALEVFQNVLNALISLGVVAVVFFIGWAGFLLMTGGSNPATRTKAKNRMLSGVVGLAVILGAFLIVDTVMKILYNPDTALEKGTFGPWNEILSGAEDNYCVVVNETPGVLNNGSVMDIISNALNLGTTNSSTKGAATTPGGTISGGYTYDPGIKAQTVHASGELTALLSCMRPKLPAGVGRISSISDSAIVNGSKTFNKCAASGCAHTINSCHYGGKACVGRSLAVDFGDEDNASVLKAAAISCGANTAVNEGDHLHVSVGKSCGCN
ncbi:MAG: hypothetical protein AB202_00150 [Parcubacteria bacterium C7867-007]|nr:MAG: hypothetical protein AB202_00150 [Parcubacteria bacterium C7867-007]